MRKIALSFLTMVAAIAVAAGVTYSVFNDTETSENNTFATGQIMLDMAEANPMPFSVEGIMMGDTGKGSVSLTSVSGNEDGQLKIAIQDFVQNENGCIEPEIEAGDPCGAGDLDLGFRMAMYLDVNKDGVYNQADGDIELEYSGNTNTTAGLQFARASQYVGDNWTPFAMSAGDSVDLVIEWSLPLPFDYPKHENIMQTDSLEFDVVATLEQLP